LEVYEQLAGRIDPARVTLLWHFQWWTRYAVFPLCRAGKT